MIVRVPAKLNVSLRIEGRREDGFHELETLMVPVPGLHDVLEIEMAEAFRFTCANGDVPTDEGNLVVMAVRAFEAAIGAEVRCAVHLEKHIPHGAGLGGGSSDAAGTLLALNSLHGQPLASERLLEIAAGIGSDVPFFMKGTACWCRGRGEILESTHVSPFPVLLAKPGFGVSTPQAYRAWAGSRELAGVRYSPQECGGVLLGNDLERPVFGKFLFLAELKMWFLRQGEVRAALMSGSGATVFAVLRDADMGEALAERLKLEMGADLWIWRGETGE